ncbi:MAG: hypothetical protein M1831_000391 [Alyxoria varia]|nr:MAG: hypothetical protein M1831_000391 [Alyxoria varia]
MAENKVSPKRQQELQYQYQNYKNTLQQLAQKIGDVEQEIEEHKYVHETLPTLCWTVCRAEARLTSLLERLVLETLEPLPQERKCFRMINGILVERIVKDVVPDLKTNWEGLKKVLDDLMKQYQTTNEEMEKWKNKNKIQVVQQ